MPRLTSDADLISAAARKLVATATGYVDRRSEHGVVAYQEERDHRLQGRLSIVKEASMRIGTTLDILRTTQELADVATERFADLVTVDLFDAVLRGDDAPAEGPFVLRRFAQRSAGEGAHASPPRPERAHTFPDGSAQARALVTGRPSRHHVDAAAAAPPDALRAADARRIHSTLVVPLRARDRTLGVAHFLRHRTPGRFDDEAPDRGAAHPFPARSRRRARRADRRCAQDRRRRHPRGVAALRPR